jgi:hypothetical protein
VKHPRRVIAVLFVPMVIVLLALLLHSISPWRQSGPVIRLLVGPDYSSAAAFDARALNCSDQHTGSVYNDNFRLQTDCNVTLNGQPLALRVQYHGYQGTCSATYGGGALPCQTQIALYNAPLPSVFVQSDLGLDPATLRSLPGTNALFYINEQTWLWTRMVVALLIAITATGLWARSRPVAPLSLTRLLGLTSAYAVLGLGVFGVVQFALIFALLSAGLVD